MDRDSEGEYVALPMKCFACQARDRMVRKWQTDDNSDTAGLLIGIVDPT